MPSEVFPTIGPALSPAAHLGITVLFITLYTVLFAYIYFQLWMILYFKHKRLSYRTVFLFLCLIWASLRITLFSYYLKNFSVADDLEIILYWLLFCLPICVQFFTLSLMVIFFVQVVFSSGRNATHSVLIWLSVAVGPIIFLVTNIVCAVITKQSVEATANFHVVLLRVLVNDLLFIIYGIILSACIFQMIRQRSTTLLLQAEGITVRQALIACILILILYSSRACYNLIAVSKSLIHLPDFGYGWLDISDQADIGSVSKGYLVFGAVLLCWEFLPTLIVVLAFRVSWPQKPTADIAPLIQERPRPRVCFFDNPRRYDSDDDLVSRGSANMGTQGLFTSTSYSVNQTVRDLNGLGGGSLPYVVSSPPSLHVPHRISYSLRQSRALSPQTSVVHPQAVRTVSADRPANIASHIPPSTSPSISNAILPEDPSAQFYNGT